MIVAVIPNCPTLIECDVKSLNLSWSLSHSLNWQKNYIILKQYDISWHSCTLENNKTLCKWYWDIIMFTCPDSISKLLILELPAGQRAAYPDWASPRGCGSAVSITSLALFLWQKRLFCSDWQRRSPPMQSRARDLSSGRVLSIHHGLS